MKKFNITTIILIISSLQIYAQQATDSLKDERFTVHGQSTFISQYKPTFSAKYSGTNSLVTRQESQISTTFTLFLGARLWKGASAFFNPEVAGGSGLSGSVGVGASTNGETYRIGNPSPTFELARLYFTQILTLNNEYKYHESDQNTLSGKVPTNYLALTIGKICVSDFFDKNKYSHDPRTQFMSWALMSNGAWDFPANTRGYTPSIVLEWVTPNNELRYDFSLLPTVANGMAMNWDVNKAGSHTIEYTHNYNLSGKNGTVRLFTFLNYGNMGNYNESLALNSTSPDIINTRKYGRTKYGFGLNAEQAINSDLGVFFRAGWNDGNNETWAFTEIDRTVSLGLSATGNRWNRPNDNVGLAHVISGISTPHLNYLKAGGMGFELGDGNLNYSLENLTEFYYSFQMSSNISLSAAYQHIINPGYNKDRGPVDVLSVRLHLQI
ncbi:MAG: carbohydrate porin [Paludibacter sp.]|nr:carbohydrate porin [Paludibacter sp.]